MVRNLDGARNDRSIVECRRWVQRRERRARVHPGRGLGSGVLSGQVHPRRVIRIRRLSYPCECAGQRPGQRDRAGSFLSGRFAGASDDPVLAGRERRPKHIVDRDGRSKVEVIARGGREAIFDQVNVRAKEQLALVRRIVRRVGDASRREGGDQKDPPGPARGQDPTDPRARPQHHAFGSGIGRPRHHQCHRTDRARNRTEDS